MPRSGAIARPWTPADVPLLDELAELLGPVEATERASRRRQAADAAERAEAVEFAAELVGSLVENDAIVLPFLETETFVQWIASRNTRTAPAGSLSEQALADRTWAYGHVVVDEGNVPSAKSTNASARTNDVPPRTPGSRQLATRHHEHTAEQAAKQRDDDRAFGRS